MKKVLAIILSIAMLFGVLAMNTFAETTKPTVTVQSQAVNLNEEIDITVTLDNFSTVKGMDLVISTKNDVEFKSVSADKVTLDNTNSKVEAKKVHIVDLVPANTDKIILTIKAVAKEEATINVSGELAESGEKLFDSVAYTDGSITVAVLEPKVEVENQTATENTEITAPAKYFIPYGSLYIGNASEENYPEKDENGKFAIEAGKTYSYTQYLIPDSGIMTFGVSNSTIKVDEADTSALRFGTYSNKAGKTGFGTMVIAGDVEEFFAKFNASLTDKEIAERINSVYVANNSEGKYAVVKMNFNNNANQVRIYKVAQTKYMWQNNDAIEYAVSVYNLESDDKCAAIGYHTVDNASVFSDTIKGK